ncbi:hypothetical protein HDV03_002199 [Kappamyces sp. JEL0829]|nr:hypothetical protein HDV03_002199 [Kappamyces sp. JEL0829]
MAKLEQFNRLLDGFPVKLKYNKKMGRYIQARQRLKEGKVVLTENATSFVIFHSFLSEYCGHCLKRVNHTKNGGILQSQSERTGLWCQDCGRQAFWCSVECKGLDRNHAQTCSYLRAVSLSGIAGAASVDFNLMRLLVHVMAASVSANPSGTPYSCVESLVSNQKSFTKEFVAAVEIACADLGASLRATELGHFSVKDMVKLVCKINSNSHAVHDPLQITSSAIGVGLFPLTAMLNHSCQPNAVYATGDEGQMVVKSIRPIAEGEQVFVSYVDLFAPRWERRGVLLTTKFFWCECQRCSSCDTDLQLDGFRCSECHQGHLLSKDGQSWTCTHCSFRPGAAALQCILADIDVQSGVELLQAGLFENAIVLLEASLKKAQQHLDPLHSTNLLLKVNLLNAYSATRDFVGAIRFCLAAIDQTKAMAAAVGLGLNLVELANYYEKLVELVQICGEAQKQKLLESPWTNSELAAMIIEGTKVAAGIRSICNAEVHI